MRGSRDIVTGTLDILYEQPKIWFVVVRKLGTKVMPMCGN